MLADGGEDQRRGLVMDKIEGVAGLNPIEHAVVPDRIAAGTWAFAAATTRGDIEVVGEARQLQRARAGPGQRST